MSPQDLTTSIERAVRVFAAKPEAASCASQGRSCQACVANL